MGKVDLIMGLQDYEKNIYISYRILKIFMKVLRKGNAYYQGLEYMYASIYVNLCYVV